jgi:hypothetical protein
MYRREILVGLPIVSRSFDVLQEILVRVEAEGWRIREIPFHYMSRGAGRSHVRFLRFGWAYLKTLVRMWQFRNSIDADGAAARMPTGNAMPIRNPIGSSSAAAAHRLSGPTRRPRPTAARRLRAPGGG